MQITEQIKAQLAKCQAGKHETFIQMANNHYYGYLHQINEEEIVMEVYRRNVKFFPQKRVMSFPLFAITSMQCVGCVILHE